MKNIFLLPTDQPSRLQLNVNTGKLILFDNIQSEKESVHLSNQNIYITSSEEIKVGDHILDIVNGEVMISKGKMLNNPYVKKIIITTDPKLIADGVQSIDDEFLEWFVKNSSCEFVEVAKQEVILGYYDAKGLKKIYDDSYKIIIPQKEPKQDLEKEMFELEQELDIPSYMRWHNSKPKQEKKPHSFCETPEEKCVMNYCGENGCQNRKRHLVEPHEQEKLEKAAENYSQGWGENDDVKSFIAGGKHMAERMYSEEDMIAIVEKSRKTGLSAEYLLLTEQFKKK